MDDAIGAFQKAVDCEPGFSDARNNLANTLKDVGDLPRAMAQYDRELSLRPGNWTVGSNRLYTMYFHPEFDPARILEEHRKWNQSHAEPLAAQIREHDNDPSAHRRLRIGYVSADFRQHPVGLAFEPLLANHDREQFEIYCFGTSGIEDRVTERIRTSANHWHSVKALNDADFPQLIRRCRIDILVDLTLHMGHHRLLAFAQKPAPVQMTYLGYPGTTGVRAIDYRLSDPIIDPPGSERWHSEQTLCLPRTYLCWRWGGAEIPISELPAKNRGVTFGSLNNFCKVTPQVLGVWGKLMAKVKDSRLVLKCPPGSASERVRKLLAASGIAADRIELTSSLPWEEYSRLYHRIDITLDPFPYPGHTTSLDGLWMGVPVVTLRGKTSVGRAGASLLHNLKLQELVAEDEDQYIQIAAGLAQDLPRLGGLRQSLRERLRASPIMDEPGFARDVEGVYRQAWRTWCARGKS